jgi:hypothetical protein
VQFRLAVIAVDRRAGGEDQPATAGLAHGAEQFERRQEGVAQVDLRVGDAGRNVGIGGQVPDRPDPTPVTGGGERELAALFGGQVGLHETKGRIGQQVGEEGAVAAG